MFKFIVILSTLAAASQLPLLAKELPEKYRATADQAISKQAAEKLANAFWEIERAQAKESLATEYQERKLVIGDKSMRFEYSVFGDAPKGGRRLYISMHGGGGAPPRVNDQQWRNQIRLYQPREGVYVAPRAPTDTWNLWHQAHIDDFFTRLIQCMVAFENVDPNKVYIMGYSAGGDGVYQLAPRMADRLAAAAMMAGHPNETSPLGLRNLPFNLQVGALDAGYKRNEIAKTWGEKLAALHKDDPQGYVHSVKIHKGKAHWMDRADAPAVEWMAQYTRNPYPTSIVWKQDDIVHSHFYWLSVADPTSKDRALTRAHRDGSSFILESDYPEISILLNDHMLDLDQPINVTLNGQAAFAGKVKRTAQTLWNSLQQRHDPAYLFAAKITVKSDEK